MTSSESRSFGQRREGQPHLIRSCTRHFENLLDVGQLHDPGSTCFSGFDPRRSGTTCCSAPVRLQEEAGLEGLQGEQAEGVPLREALQGGGGARALQQGDAEGCQTANTQPQSQAQTSGQVGRGRLLGKAGARRLHVDHLDAVQVGLMDLIVCGTRLHLRDKDGIRLQDGTTETHLLSSILTLVFKPRISKAYRRNVLEAETFQEAGLLRRSDLVLLTAALSTALCSSTLLLRLQVLCVSFGGVGDGFMQFQG